MQRHFDLENTFTDKKATYLNAFIGLETTRWTLQVRGRNLADRFEPEDVAPGILTPGIRYQNQPRQITGEFLYRF